MEATLLTAETKVCRKCGVEKHHAQFHIDRSTPDGLKYRCRICTNKAKAAWRARNVDKIRASRRAEHSRNRERYLAYYATKGRRNVFKWKLETKFGITVDKFDKMVEEQSGLCAICAESPSEANGHRHKHRLHIDHDHKTGKVRGLLCNNCNAALGYFHDNPDRLLLAYDYLTSQCGEQE